MFLFFLFLTICGYAESPPEIDDSDDESSSDIIAEQEILDLEEELNYNPGRRSSLG